MYGGSLVSLELPECTGTAMVRWNYCELRGLRRVKELSLRRGDQRAGVAGSAGSRRVGACGERRRPGEAGVG